MKITKKRINKLENNFPNSFWDKTVIPAIILDINEHASLINKLGFSGEMEIGETILPAAVGPITKFNSEGRENPDKTKPKETKYREIEWSWEQWAGWGETESMSDFVLVPYERYPRIFIEPPSVELQISKKENKNIFVTTSPVTLSRENQTEALHKINLFLEIFKSCEILDENKVPIVRATKTLNWTILPPGKKPWAEQKELIQPLIELVKDKRAKPVVISRLEDINDLGPEFTAIGNQGFSGYVIFGFPDKNIYILESAFYGNAIYVFNEDWETLSKKTKAEILKNNLQIDRITHNGEKTRWINNVENLLKNK